MWLTLFWINLILHSFDRLDPCGFWAKWIAIAVASSNTQDTHTLASAGNRCRLVAVATVAGLDCSQLRVLRVLRHRETHRTDDERTPAPPLIVYVRSSVPFSAPRSLSTVFHAAYLAFPPPFSSHHSTSRDRSSHGTRRSETPRMLHTYALTCEIRRESETSKKSIRRRRSGRETAA